jgi:hypothetical protein
MRSQFKTTEVKLSFRAGSLAVAHSPEVERCTANRGALDTASDVA